jgi:hypothetical protein
MDDEQSGRRKPGRPKGSSRYSETDPPLLRKMAEMMVEEADLTKTAAIKQFIRLNDTAGLHRLQGKFARDGERLLAEAREARRERIKQARAAELESAMKRALQGWKDAEAVFARALISPSGQAIVRNVQALGIAINHRAARLTESGGVLQLVGDWARRPGQSRVMQQMREIQRLMQTDDFTKRVQEVQRALGAWGQVGRFGRPLI